MFCVQSKTLLIQYYAAIVLFTAKHLNYLSRIFWQNKPTCSDITDS